MNLNSLLKEMGLVDAFSSSLGQAEPPGGDSCSAGCASSCGTSCLEGCTAGCLAGSQV